jgi:hypothetical protein
LVRSRRGRGDSPQAKKTRERDESIGEINEGEIALNERKAD